MVIGPSANRIGNASFDLDGATYPLKANDGANNLHSDRERGWHKMPSMGEMAPWSTWYTPSYLPVFS